MSDLASFVNLVVTVLSFAIIGRALLSWFDPGMQTPVGRFLRDITEAKRAQEAVTSSHDLLVNLARLVPGVIYQYRLDPDGRSAFPYSSPGMNDIYEVTPEDVREDATPVFGRLHPDDLSFVTEAIFESARTLDTFFCEFRVVLPRQRLRWRHCQAHPQRLPDGAVEWHGIATNISNSKESEAQLKKSRQQLAELSNHLEVVKEEERERISRDIHDELGSLLVRIKIEVALLAGKLPETAAALRDKAASIEALLDQALATASRVVRELRPGILKEFGLAAAIECQSEDFSQRTGIACHVQCDDGVSESLHEPLPEISLALFRIAQEALTNIAKHAQATRVFLRLHRASGHIVLEIRDNGRGISEADLQKPKSFGLRGIRERLASLGGDLSIVAAEQGGTHMIARVPENAEAAPPTPQEVQRTLF